MAEGQPTLFSNSLCVLYTIVAFFCDCRLGQLLPLANNPKTAPPAPDKSARSYPQRLVCINNFFIVYYQRLMVFGCA